MVKAGKEYMLDGNLNEKVYVIESREKYALMKYENQYVIGYKPEITKDNKIQWAQGHYYNSITLASLMFDEKTLEPIKVIESLKKNLNFLTPFIRFSAIVELETHNSRERTLNKWDYKKYEAVFDEYSNNDEMQLISEDIENMEEAFDFESIIEQIKSRLVDEDILPESVSEEELEKQANDVFDKAIEENDEPYNYIIGLKDEYLDGFISDIKEREEEEEM